VRQARRALLALAPALLATTAAACGGVSSADLFIVERSGTVPHAALSVLVSEEGVVQCNRGASHRLSDPALIEARTIQEELHNAATHHLSLPARPGSVYGYRVRDGEGSVSFADNSSGQPKVLRALQLFTLQVAQRACHVAV
jgi:hypothetical protein